MDSTLKLILNKLKQMDRRFDGLEKLLEGRSKSHYTVEEVAKITGRSSYTVRTHWIGTGHLKASKLRGGKYLVDASELDRFIASGRGSPMTNTKPQSATKSLKSLARRFNGRVTLLYPIDVAKQVEQALKDDEYLVSIGIEPRSE